MIPGGSTIFTHRYGRMRDLNEIPGRWSGPLSPSMLRPVDRGLRPGRHAAWTAGRAFASHLQRAFQPPLPAQRLMTLIKRPS
jgi:hypothetical protein